MYTSDIHSFLFYDKESALQANDKTVAINVSDHNGLGEMKDGVFILTAEEVNKIGHEDKRTGVLKTVEEVDANNKTIMLQKVWVMNMFEGKTPKEIEYEQAKSAYDNILTGGKSSVTIGGRSFASHNLTELSKQVELLSESAKNERKSANGFTEKRPVLWSQA